MKTKKDITLDMYEKVFIYENISSKPVKQNIPTYNKKIHNRLHEYRYCEYEYSELGRENIRRYLTLLSDVFEIQPIRSILLDEIDIMSTLDIFIDYFIKLNEEME